MLPRNAWGVGAALDSDDARLGRLQPAPASKISSTAEPIKRSPAMFISPLSWQAVIRCPSGGQDDLTRHKISDREPAVACDPGKRWMANTHNVDRRLARGSLHRLVRPLQVQRIEANGYFFLVKRTCPKRSILSPL